MVILNRGYFAWTLLRPVATRFKKIITLIDPKKFLNSKKNFCFKDNYSTGNAHRPIGVMDPGFQRVGHLSITRQLIGRQKFLLNDTVYPLDGSCLLSMDCHTDEVFFEFLKIFLKIFFSRIHQNLVVIVLFFHFTKLLVVLVLGIVFGVFWIMAY